MSSLTKAKKLPSSALATYSKTSASNSSSQPKLSEEEKNKKLLSNETISDSDDEDQEMPLASASKSQSDLTEDIDDNDDDDVDEEEEQEEESDVDEEMTPEQEQEVEVEDLQNVKYTLKPKAGFRELPITESSTSKDFTYETFEANPDLELWLIRIPSTIKPKHLSGLALSIDGSGALAVSSKKEGSETTYQVEVSSKSEGQEGVAAVGGEEMAGLRCLLPSRKRGKYLQAPKSINKTLVLLPPLPEASTTPQFHVPAPKKSSTLSLKPPKTRHLQPKGVLKFRNGPWGCEGLGPVENDEDGALSAVVRENIAQKEPSGLAAAAKDLLDPLVTAKKKEKKRKVEASEGFANGEGETGGEKKKVKKSKKTEKS